MSSSYSVPKLRYTPHSEYENFCCTLQNRSTIPLFILCGYECLMTYILNFIFQQCPTTEILTRYSEYKKVHCKCIQVWQKFIIYIYALHFLKNGRILTF